MQSPQHKFFHSILAAAGLFLVLHGGGCLNNPSASVASQDLPLSMSGKIEDSSGQPASGVGIFVEQEIQAEQFSDAQGSFAFDWSSARLEELRLRYAPLGQPLRLYFIKEGSPGVSAVYSKLKALQIGTLDLGVIRLQTEVAISGQVRANKSFETNDSAAEGALVHIGRNAALTDADGRFAVFAPAQSLLPVRITQKGYVQTKGSWNVGTMADNRDFVLYDRLDVAGKLAVPSTFRAGDPTLKSLDLAVSGNAMCRWIRLAIDEGELAESAASAKWISIDEAVQIPLGEGTPSTLYYQFADQEKKILSPIFSLELRP